MKRTIAVGHGLMILWVFATAQVMCKETNKEDAELYKVINDNKEGMVTQIILDNGFVKASKLLHITSLSTSDINPTTEDDDDDVADGAEEQKQQYYRRSSPDAFSSVAPEVDNTETGIYGERQMSQAKDNLPVIDDAKRRSTNYGGQESAYHPRSLNSVSGAPRGRRDKSQKKDPEDSRPAVMVQL